MDKIDELLLEAWNRVGARCRRDRVEALKRSQRRFMGVLTRPMRECCLVVRASDTRLSDPLMLDVDPSAVREHLPHEIVLTGAAIRELTKPVDIPYPGVTYAEAAERLGRTVDSLYEWVTKGVFRVERYRMHGYPENGKRPGPLPKGPRGEEILAKERAEEARKAADPGNPWNDRFGGGGRPYVWTPSPVDPNNFHGRVPHAVWGTLWQWQWEKMPANFVQVVERVPRWRMQGKPARPRFLGWEFVCPGRLNAQGEYVGCGKRCTYLYGPQRVWTLAKAIGEQGFEVGPPFVATKESAAVSESQVRATRGVASDRALCPGLAFDQGKFEVVGEWFPGLADTVLEPRGGSFACKECWGVRSVVMSGRMGWNDFITQISGGLLYGREVKRPLDICPVVRKKAVYTQKRRKRVQESGVVELRAG